MRRTHILLIILAGLALSSTPVLAKDFWVKAQGSGCQVWSDEAMDAKEVMTWSGACKDGKASGDGKLTWTKGGQPAGSYEGFMSGGKLNGQGLLRLNVKGGISQLEGTFKDGDVEGGGFYKGADGSVYEGELKNWKPHGRGYRKIGDDEYAGEFENGKRHGLGLALGERTAYIGEFDNDVASGSGVLEDAAGGRYHGQFKNNKPHGFGTYVAKDGTVHQGRFVDGKADGVLLVRSSTQAEPVIETWKGGKKVK